MAPIFIIANLRTKAYVDPVKVQDRTGKFPDHCRFGSPTIGAVESLLCRGRDWYMEPLVWTGSFANPENDLQVDYYWTGELKPANLIDYCKYAGRGQLQEVDLGTLPAKHFRYILNHDKKEYVDVVKVSSPKYCHPLPYLTVEGINLGIKYGLVMDGYPGQLVGSWSRNRLSVQNERPNTSTFRELKTTDFDSWTQVGHAIQLRRLIEQGRATALPIEEKKNKELFSVQKMVAEMEEDQFRNVLSFLTWARPLAKVNQDGLLP